MPKNEAWKGYTSLQRKLYRELYRKDFHEFVKAFWECIEDREFVDGILVEYYCELGQYLARFWIKTEISDKQINIEDYAADENEEINIIDVRGDQRNICLNVPP